MLKNIVKGFLCHPQTFEEYSIALSGEATPFRST